MKEGKKYLLLGLLVGMLAGLWLNSNPFGNQPDVVADESYFLTSALQSVRTHTLPGWEFSASGTYYGGPQAYVDAVVMVPVLAVIVALTHSVHGAMFFVAYHTGDLLHVLRLVNALLLLVAIAWLGALGIRKKVPVETMWRLGLFLSLLLGSSIVAMLLHTAKIWVIQLILDAGMGTLFLMQETAIAKGLPPPLSRPRYLALLLWVCVLAFFQTYAGVAAVGLWLIYSLLLEHVSVREGWEYVRRRWWLFGLFALTQISFLYRAFYLREQGPSEAASADYLSKTLVSGIGHVDGLARFVQPIWFAVGSQPLLAVWVVLAGAALCSGAYRRMLGWRPRMLVIVALHPVIIWIIFYVGFGFSIAPRYSIFLIIATAFSIACLLPMRGRTGKVFVVIAAAWALFVQGHASVLWHRPATDLAVVQELRAEQLTASTTILVEWPALLSLPMNAQSLAALDDVHKAMSRYAFLAHYPQEADRYANFAPRVLYGTASTSALLRPGDIILTTARNAGRPQEPDVLPPFLRATQLGAPYTLTVVPGR